MNIKLKFANVTFEKKISVVFGAIVMCLIIAISTIALLTLTNHSRDQVESTEEKAELVSLNISEDIKKTAKSISFISTLISDNDVGRYITSSQVTSLLNDLISSDEKIFAAFVMLDKDEFEHIESISSRINTNDEAAITEAIDKLDGEDLEDTNSRTESESNILSVSDNVVGGVNKLIYRSGGSTYETTLDRINILEYKKNYLSVLLTKKPQMMQPYTNMYDGLNVTTCTYTVPILKGGVVEGVIGFDIDVSELNEDLNEKNDILSATYMVTDKEGLVITSNENKYVGRTIDEIYSSDSSADILAFFKENNASGTASRFKEKTFNLLNDDLYITVPIVVDGNHIWNVTIVTTIDRVITNSIAIVLFVTILNILAFTLLIFGLWLSFGRIISKKFNGIFDKVEKELAKIKATSGRILEDIEDLEEIEIEEFDRDDDDEKEENEEKEIVPEVTPEDDEKLDALLNKVDLDKYVEQTEDIEVNQDDISNQADVKDEPIKEEPKEDVPVAKEEVSEEAKEETKEETKEDGVKGVIEAASAAAEKATAKIDVIPEDSIDSSKYDDTIIKEAPEEKGIDGLDLVDDKTDDKADEENTEEDETINDEAADESSEDAEEEPVAKLDLSKPAEDENGNRLSAIDQLASQDIATDASPEDINDILANKDGSIEDDAFMKEAEEKMQKAMEDKMKDAEPAVVKEDSQPVVSEPVIPEPVIPEPKIAETPSPAIKEEKTVEEKPAEVVPASKPAEPAPAPKPEPKPEPRRPVPTISTPEEDMAQERPRGNKLTNREMDSLLKELETKRKSENEALGIREEITSDFSSETTLDPDEIKDLVGKITKE